MSDRIEVPAHETGVVRLFAVDLPPDQIEAFADPDPDSDDDNDDADNWPLLTALGLRDLNPSYVEIFPVDRLEDLGLTGYLTEGYNISAEDLQTDRTMLNQIKGTVALISSGAFRGKAQTLRLQQPLRWLGTWAEPLPELDLTPIRTDSAQGTTGDTGGGGKPRFPRWLGWLVPLAGIALGALIFFLSPDR